MPPSAAAVRAHAAKQKAATQKKTIQKKDVQVREKGLVYLQGKYNDSKAQADSVLADRTALYPKFDLEQCTLGKHLGSGGFGTVSEVTAVQVGNKVLDTTRAALDNTEDTTVSNSSNSSNTDDTNDTNVPRGNADDDAIVQTGMMESQAFIAKHCIRKGGDARYAIKKLKPEVMNDTPLFFQGVMDLAIEARFLSDMEHPNIIKLRGMAKQSPFGYDSNGNYSYFLLLDRLYDTLERRLDRWGKVVNKKAKKGIFCRSKTKPEQQEALFKERILVAFDLAAALDYLHNSCSMCYRDIKPENIGFDIRDDVKLFDFGLSKVMRQVERLQDGTYKMTSMTGSPRYMAPEVGMGLPYNQTCDSYSFAILLWQILSCQIPYEHYNMTSLKTKVWSGPHKRPLLPKEPDQNFSASIQELLKLAWEPNLQERASISFICAALRKECLKVQEGDDSNLKKDRRRSTFVFDGSSSSAGRVGSSVLSGMNLADLQQLAELSENSETSHA